MGEVARLALAASFLAASLLAGCGSSDPPPPCPLEGPKPDLNLTVVDPSGAPVCGAFVTLTSTAQSQTYQPSGRDGDCNLYSARIPPDTYALSIAANGFAPFAKSVVLVYADERCGVPAPYAETITLKPAP